MGNVKKTTKNRHKNLQLGRKNSLKTKLEAARIKSESLSKTNEKIIEVEKLAKEEIHLLNKKIEVQAKENTDLGMKVINEKTHSVLTRLHWITKFRNMESNLKHLAVENFHIKNELRTKDKEIQELRRKLDDCEFALYEAEHKVQNLSEKVPNVNQIRKPFEEAGKKTKDRRCELVLDYVQKILEIGDVNSFVSYLVHFISDSPKYKFRLKLSEEETAIGKLRFKWSDGKMKEFKKFTNYFLNFDILSSRIKTDIVLKSVNVTSHYNIEVVELERKTLSGRSYMEKSTIVQIKDIKKYLEKRLSALAKNGRLEDGDITVGVGGDKGGDITKVVLVLGNTPNPNNPQGLVLLGMFRGHDNHHNLSSKLGRVFQMINELSHVDFEIPGLGNVRRKVKKIPIGDCLFLSALYNHPGPSSGSPCVICPYEFVTHGAQKALIGNSKFDEPRGFRTLAEYKQTGRPLIEIEPLEICLPPLHVFNGVTQKYVVDPLFATADLIDNPDRPNTIKEQKAYVKELDAKMAELLVEEKELKAADNELEQLSLAYQKQTITGKVRQGKFDKCQSPICLVNSVKKFFNKNEKFKCPKCNHMYHSFCNNRVQSIDCDYLLSGKTSTECVNCQMGVCTPSSQIKAIDAIRREIEKRMEDTEIVFSDCKQKRSEFDEEIKKDGIRRKLEKMFRRIGCDDRVWYHDLTGNQTRRMLREPNIKLLLSVFPDVSKVESIGQVMKELCFLMSNADNAYKSDKEIEEIDESLKRLNETLRTYHPDYSVILKHHMLSSHLIPYLKRNKQWGRISEQGLESLHSLHNNFNRSHCSVRDPHLKTTLFLQTFMNYNNLYDFGRYWS